MTRAYPKILLVEDEPDACSAIQSYLGRRGYMVSTTSSGQEALSMVQISKPDIVLLDFKLHDMNGKDVLSQLRASDQKTKVIVMTGELLKDEDIQKVQSLGISAYLQKPVLLGPLEKIVSEILGSEFLPQIVIQQQPAKVHGSCLEKSFIHEISNLLGIIRNRCENFILDINEGVYKNKTDKEVIHVAMESMDVVIKTVDRATDLVRKNSKE